MAVGRLDIAASLEGNRRGRRELTRQAGIALPPIPIPIFNVEPEPICHQAVLSAIRAKRALWGIESRKAESNVWPLKVANCNEYA